MVQLTNMYQHPVSAKIVVTGADGKPTLDYVTLAPRGKVTLGDGHQVHKNWSVLNPKVIVKAEENS